MGKVIREIPFLTCPMNGNKRIKVTSMNNMLPGRKLSLEEFISIFSKYGEDPGERYLQEAYPRMCATKRFVFQGIRDPGTVRMIDIGAHWLHTSVLYAMEGVSVTAAELAAIDEFTKSKMIPGVAHEFGIRQLTYRDLSDPVELAALPERSFDLVVFTEILEHITFNPIKMWRALYRLLDVGGKIILTTPNFFHCSNVLKEIVRYGTGRSSGISVEEVIGVNTYAHHWKLYSARDMKKYFRLLSPDFSVNRIEYYTYTSLKCLSLLRVAKRVVENTIPYLREGLYIEITKTSSSNGIVATPSWWLS
jgi:2-polyprenyl-3-methyl-5-hydroxy-6-metoxy-1,4-benzoquinol methylase